MSPQALSSQRATSITTASPTNDDERERIDILQRQLYTATFMSPEALSDQPTSTIIYTVHLNLTDTSTMTALPSSTNTVGNVSVLPTSSHKAPTLVVAFVAIGFFSAILAFFFSQFRRGGMFTGMRAISIMNRPEPRDIESQTIPVDVPKLWDLRNGGGFAWGQVNEKGGSDVKWANLMPLSVRAAPKRAELREHPLNNTIPGLNPIPCLNHRRNRRQHNDEKKSATDDEMTMQVAVTIVLPSPQYPVYIKIRNINKHHENMDRQEMTDYCIGTYECSWQ